MVIIMTSVEKFPECPLCIVSEVIAGSYSLSAELEMSKTHQQEHRELHHKHFIECGDDVAPITAYDRGIADLFNKYVTEVRA